MKIDDALAEVRRWYDEGSVGNLVIFRAPKSDYVDMIAESTVKLFEMDNETKESVRRTFDLLDSEKVEMFRDRDGYADRVKVIRRL